MAAGAAWVLNLDADLELGASPRYQPTRRVLDAMASPREALARALLAEGDRLVDERTPAGAAAGMRGRAFCPTPRALAALRRAGALPEPAPEVAILRRVNGRAFCAALGETLPGGGFVTTLEAATARLARAPEPALATRWRLKRAHGMAGRAQRVVAPGALAASDRAFLMAGLAEGGVQIEPDVAISAEFAQHGLIAAPGAGGALRLGALVRQRCDARGAWISTEPIDDAAALGELPARLEAEVRRVAAALREAGYFGPFGVDAFTYRVGAPPCLALQPRSEINARFSMGFAVGFPGIHG